jgi:hypothetical protein
MKVLSWLAAVMLIAGLLSLVGCSKEEKNMVDKAAQDVKKAGDKVVEEGKKVGDEAKKVTHDAAKKVEEATATSAN